MKRLLSVLLAVCALASCQKKPVEPELPLPATPSPTASPTATVASSPTPTPVPAMPRKPVDMARLFSGLTFRTTFVTPQTDLPASVERVTDSSYEVQVTVTAKLPKASQSLEQFAKNDPKLPHVLNQMSRLIETSKVSPFFEQIYKLKIEAIRSELFDLESVISRHNFYDCETILELTGSDTGRKALLLIGDMDVNVDGSDGDRNVTVDDSGMFFQPQTSYRWPRQTDRVNPLMARYTQKLESLKKEYALPGLSSAKNKQLQGAIDHTKRTIEDLKRYSFLISTTDPTIVLPSFMLNDSTNAYGPKVGDYAVVIHEGVVYPAIVGDAGPSAKIGEASVRLAKQINARSNSNSRAVSNLKVAYLVFPGTAEPFGPPDLTKWRAMCEKYVDEIGGAAPEIFVWENTVPAWPTPTPTPSPSPTPETSASPSVQPSAIIEIPTATPSPAASPQPAVISPTEAATPQP